jgi:hypothetical protein
VRLPTIEEQPGGGQPSRFTGQTVQQQVFGQPGGMQQLTPTPTTLARTQGRVAEDVAAGRPVSPEVRSLVPDSTHRQPPPTLSNVQASIAARIAANDPTVTQAERDLVPLRAVAGVQRNDPAENITNTRKISAVYLRGVAVNRGILL